MTELLLELISFFCIRLYTTGNHWLNEIIPRLLENSADSDQCRMTDLMMEYGDIDAIKQGPSPRLMTSHLPYRNVPKNHLADGGKFIHIIRNPKDVALSAFHHYSADPHEVEEIPEFPVFLDNFLQVGNTTLLVPVMKYQKYHSNEKNKIYFL